MPSHLETAISTYRRLLLTQDVRALSAINTAYEDALGRLRPLIALVQAEIAGMDEVDVGKVFRLERWKELERQLASEIRRISDLTRWQTLTNQQRVIPMAIEAAQATVAAQSAQIASYWVRVPTQAVESMLGTFRQGSPLADLFDKISPKALDAARKELTTGLALGHHPSVVSDALVEALKISKERAMTIARTETLRAYRSASQRQYQEPSNRALLAGYRWTSARSANTCSACLAMDGTIYQVDRMMEVHVRCRCAMVPMLHGVDLSIESGAEWLAKQSAKVQDTVLGSPSAGAAYRAGEVELGDFARRTENAKWGPSYQADSLVGAQARAEHRARIAA